MHDLLKKEEGDDIFIASRDNERIELHQEWSLFLIINCLLNVLDCIRLWYVVLVFVFQS